MILGKLPNLKTILGILRGCCLFAALLPYLAPSASLSQQLEFPATGVFNGFNGHLNVIECINLSGEEGYLNVRVLGNDSGVLGEQRLFIPTSGSPHLVLNQFPIENRTGTFILEPVPDSEDRDPRFKLNCYTAVYRMSSSGATKAVEYAFMLPVTSALRGQTSGIYNSLSPEGRTTPIYNWLSIYNPGEEPIEGVVQLYNQAGEFVSGVTIEEMPPGARQDFPLGHEDGQVVGMYQITLFDTNLPYGAFLTRYSQKEDGSFNYAFPLFPQEGACDSGPIPASTMDPATNWGEVANPTRRSQQARIEVRDRNGALLHEEVKLIGGYSQEHIYLNQFLGERNVGTFRVRCMDPEDEEQRFIVQSLFYGARAENPQAIEWAYASQSRSVYGAPGDSLAAPVNTHFDAANWFKVLNLSDFGVELQHSAYALDGIKVDLNSSNVARKSLHGVSANGSLDLAVHGLTGESFVGTASACSWTEESEYSGELLRVFPDARGGIGYIMPVPAVRVRNALNADAREVSVSADKDTRLLLTSSNEERVDDSFHAYVSSQPENGRVYGDWPYYTYRPDDGFRGADSFEFRVYDGTTWSNPGRVYVGVDRYDAGVGIPEPSFGVLENAATRPSPWNEQVSGYYYVDRHHSQATDAGNEFGTPERPRQTIPDVLAPGAVVELHGRYEHTQNGLQFSITSSGTADQPIVIRGISEEERPEITRPWHVSGSFVILENLHFRAELDERDEHGPSGELVIFGPAHHVALRYSEVNGNYEGGGITVFGFLGQVASNIVLYRNSIRHVGRRWGSIEGQTPHHGVSILEGSENIWLLRNSIRDSGGHGVLVSAGTLAAMPSVHHIYLSENDATSNRYSGYWIEQAEDVVVSGNRARWHFPNSTHVEDVSSLGACMGYQYGPNRVWFINNEIHNCSYGIVSESNLNVDGFGTGNEIVLLGNIIRDMERSEDSPGGVFSDGAAIRLRGDGGRTYVMFNTLAESSAGILIPGSQSSYVLSNNIFRNISQEDIFIEQALAASASFVHNSIFDPSARIAWAAGSRSVPELQAAVPGQCVACLERDPAFENEENDDYRLTASSPARDAAFAPHLSQTNARFLELYGVTLSEDRRGTERGTVPDIGAYEYVSD